MKILAIFAALLSAPAFAADRVKRAVVPSVGGSTGVAVDPWVAEYNAKMIELERRTLELKTSMMDIPEPKGLISAAASKVKRVAIMAKVATIIAERAEAEKKLAEHVSGYKEDGFRAKSSASAPEFEEKTDSASLKPKDDRIMRGSAKGPASSGGGFSANSEFGTQGMADKPSLQKVSSRFGYSAGGNQIGAGFSTTMEPSASQINAVGATGQSSAGTMTGAGGAGLTASSTSGSDAKPSVNPGMDTLSKNTSDTESKAYEREQERLKAKEEREAQERQEEQQRKQQQQQAMMQMLQAGMQAAGQAAQAAAQAEQGQGGGGGGGDGLNAALADIQRREEDVARREQAIRDQAAAQPDNTTLQQS